MTVELNQVEPFLSVIEQEAAGMTNTARASILTNAASELRQLWEPAPGPVDPPPDPPPIDPPPPVNGNAIHVTSIADWFNKVDGANDKEVVVKDGLYDFGNKELSGNKLRVFAEHRPTQGLDGKVRPPVKINVGGANFFGGGSDLYFEGLEVYGPRAGSSGATGHAFNQVNGLEVVLCYLHHCQSSAIGGNSHVLLRRSEVASCGDPQLVGHNSGGVKTVEGGTGWEEPKLGMLCERVYAHDNIGPGLWGDRGCKFYIFRFNLCVDNHKAGIRWEIGTHVSTHDAEAEIHNNRCFGNGHLAPSDSGGIRVNSCNSAYIHDNDVGPNDGGVGITAGGDRHPVYGVRIERNLIRGGDKVNAASAPSGKPGNVVTGNGPNTAILRADEMFQP